MQVGRSIPMVFPWKGEAGYWGGVLDRVIWFEVIGDTAHIKIVSCMWSTEKSIMG